MTTTQSSKSQQLIRADRRMFSASDDNVMMKQVQATHAPDSRHVDVKPILNIIEDILRHGTPGIDGVINGTHHHMDTMQLDKANSLVAFDGVLEALAYIIQKIYCEISCKCSGGGDAHATAMALFNTLSSYSWEAKVVLCLAAFAVLYGEFWLVAQLCTTNSLAKSVSLLKQLPDILEHSNLLKPQLDALNNLIKAIMDVTKCIIDFTDLPSQYISPDTPAMATAMALIPTASYWTIRSIVACASKISSLIGLNHEFMTSTTETWELSSLAHKLSTIHDHLMKQINFCYQHIDDKKHLETYHNLMRLFETLHLDNLKILKALIYTKDDQLPLFDGSTKKRAHIEVLRRKHVLLLISDLDLIHEELYMLEQIYNESKQTQEINYDIVWVPIVDRSIPWNDVSQRKFLELQEMMPWYSVNDPLMIEPAVIRYTKEVWNFKKLPIIVPLDPQGRVASKNALHMVWIWGNMAFPFTDEREETLWKTEAWKLDLLVDGIDLNILDWISKGSFICLYGGQDIEWIRKFTSNAKAVTKELNINLEMVYVGKSNAKERVRKITSTISTEQLSHYWSADPQLWFFWARLRSMLYSKLKHGKTVENDSIMQEVMRILSFDGSEQGWAIFCEGSTVLAKAKGDTSLTSLMKFEQWRGDAIEHGFMPAFNTYLEKLHTPHHCNQLILPGINGAIPEMVVCAECGRPMEKYFMYRCCVD